MTIDELKLSDEPLADTGWSSPLELDAFIDHALGLDLDDERAFARFCSVMRNWGDQPPNLMAGG